MADVYSSWELDCPNSLVKSGMKESLIPAEMLLLNHWTTFVEIIDQKAIERTEKIAYSVDQN
jgi:hypothetical protein